MGLPSAGLDSEGPKGGNRSALPGLPAEPRRSSRRARGAVGGARSVEEGLTTEPGRSSARARGPVGGEARRSSRRARGPVGGTWLVEDCASMEDILLLGTDPNAGADGATGGDKFLVDGGSCEARSILGRIASRSRGSLSSRGPRGTWASGSTYLSTRSRSSRSRPHRPSWDRLRGL